MSSGSRQARLRRHHRGAVAAALSVATLVTLIGSRAVWIDRQVVDPEQWSQTSDRLLANRQVRVAIGSYAVDQLFVKAKLDGFLRDVLPGPLVGPTDAQLRQLGRGLAAGILGSRVARVIWDEATRHSQAQLLAILSRSGSATRPAEPVTLNLEPLLTDLVQALLGNDVVRALPGAGRPIFATGSVSGGQLVILRADQVRKWRGIVEAVRGLSVVLPLAAIALSAAAVALARGWRRLALARVGLCLAGVGVVLLVGRRLLAAVVANSLVSASSARRAVRAAWMISTTELRGAAEAALILGIVVLAITLVMRLAGPVHRRGIKAVPVIRA